MGNFSRPGLVARTYRALVWSVSRWSTIALPLLLCSSIRAQTGPNSPSSAVNNAGTGSNAWTGATNILSSNNSRATVSTRGATNYIVGSGFGFSIPAPANVLGIQVDVERSTTVPSSVALLNTWATGLTRSVSAGTNRCLVVVAGLENGTGSRNITAMTYGGQAMTQVSEIVVGSAFTARLEVWYLLEAGIALASSTTITPTYASATLVENCEQFSSAVFQFVDQVQAVSDVRSSSSATNTDPHQLGSALTTLAGSMAINAVVCGNNTTGPSSSIGGTNTYTINSSYTEGTDIYFANAGATGSGACLQTAHKSIATAGTEQPSCDFRGNVNRHVMIGLTLRRASELDSQVRLLKNGVIAGNNLANTTEWPTTEAYVTYGGATELWGQTWTLADVNASNFGVAIATQVQGGTAQVDHVRITVYSQSTLPVELIHFGAEALDGDVHMEWVTASEDQNDRFEVERSNDGHAFATIGVVAGAGHSNSTLFYNFLDGAPMPGTNYYRLKQVDTDGTSTLSQVVAVDVQPRELVLYPNPTTDGRVTLQLGAIGLHEVAIYATDMTLVRSATLTSSDPLLYLGDLRDGVYIVVVRTATGLHTKRVLKASSS
jgi:hypothetical protein